MPAPRRPEILSALLARFEQRRPIRAGSFIVTLYGDAIAPRGGSLWLGSINELTAPFGIEPGLVRTALSRLVTEGWFERNRIGRSSYYRLSRRGAAEFASAGERIYRLTSPAWDGRLHLLLLGGADTRTRAARRDALASAGLGQLAANVMLTPSIALAKPTADEIELTATLPRNPADARRLAAACWRLDDLRASYQALLDAIGNPETAVQIASRLSDEHAFQLRLLLIHEWRRIVLRDPQLPDALLPDDWPGTTARRLCAELYRASFEGCERWLDRNAVAEAGRLPVAEAGARQRFTASRSIPAPLA